MTRSGWLVACVCLSMELAAVPVWSAREAAVPPDLETAQTEPEEHLALACHWAPVIRQDTAHRLADFVTRFDYDGDWNGANNWDNMDRHPLTAHVYYSVITTPTHWFITYALFHPRDWDRIDNPLTSHENDLEGMLLVVLRDGSAAGRLVLMETVSHWDFFKYGAPGDVTPGHDKLDGSIPLEGHRPVVQVEARGHGIRAWNGKGFPGGDGVVYRLGSEAQVPRGQSDPDCRFELVPILSTLWARRFEVGPGKTYGKQATFPGGTYGVAFLGRKHGDDKANAPWGWDDKDDGPVGLGDFFLDPARMVTVHLRFIRPVSREYEYNPYIGGETDLANAGRARRCQEQFAVLHGE